MCTCHYVYTIITWYALLFGILIKSKMSGSGSLGCTFETIQVLPALDPDDFACSGIETKQVNVDPTVACTMGI